MCWRCVFGCVSFSLHHPVLTRFYLQSMKFIVLLFRMIIIQNVRFLCPESSFIQYVIFASAILMLWSLSFLCLSDWHHQLRKWLCLHDKQQEKCSVVLCCCFDILTCSHMAFFAFLKLFSIMFGSVFFADLFFQLKYLHTV